MPGRYVRVPKVGPIDNLPPEVASLRLILRALSDGNGRIEREVALTWCQIVIGWPRVNGAPPPNVNGSRTCEVDGCERAHHARGLCAAHYRRWQVHGRRAHRT